jgi:hypothetical protein
LIKELKDQFEILEAEEKKSEDADVKARIDNERMALQDLLEELLEKINTVMLKVGVKQ